MTMAGLPDDGEVRLGTVRLPPGRQAFAEDDGRPVAWITDQEVRGPGRVWSALRGLHTDTGLVPVLIDPWDRQRDFFFTGNADPGEISQVDPVREFAQRWPVYDDAAGVAPQGTAGLAPAEEARLPAAVLDAALDSLDPALIGLVPAGRPADVLAAVGWVAFDDLSYYRNGVWLGSVLRSFEDRTSPYSPAAFTRTANGPWLPYHPLLPFGGNPFSPK